MVVLYFLNMSALLDKVRDLLSDSGIDFCPGVDACGEESIDLVRTTGNPDVAVQIRERFYDERIIVEARIDCCMPEGQYRAACVLLNEFNYRSHAQVRMEESYYCYRRQCDVYPLVSSADVFGDAVSKEVLQRYICLTCEGLREAHEVLLRLLNGS